MYYQLLMDTDRPNDIVLHYEKDFDIDLLKFIVGEVCHDWNGRFVFFYDRCEGSIPTDYLANDKGWFVVSRKLKDVMNSLNTEIQFFPVKIYEKNTNNLLNEYYIANIIRVVDALCLEKSKYFTTEIPRIGTIYTVSKYGIYAKKTENSDIFKLKAHQNIPIFVSEKFKQHIEDNNITGIDLIEVSVV